MKSGSIYPMSLTKQLRAQRLCASLRLPAVNIVDSGGAFLPLQAEIFNRGGNIFRNLATMQAYNDCPQIAIVVGDCVAGGAYSPTMSDHAAMVRKLGTLFLGGPALVRAATGEVITAEELGGATTHCKVSGTTDYFVEDEKKAFNHLRDLMSIVKQSEERFLPFEWDDTYAFKPVYSAHDLDGLIGIQNNSTGKHIAYCFLARILDRSELCEFRNMYSTALVCGWGKIGGKVIGILCATGMPINRQSAESACQLVQMCDDTKIPLLCVQMSTHHGWSSYNQMQDAIRAHAQLMSALATTDSHKITLNIGDSVGPDYWLTGAPALECTYHLSYPTSRVAYSAEHLNDQNDLSNSSALIETDIIVLPANTRQTLITCLKTLPLKQNASGFENKRTMLKL